MPNPDVVGRDRSGFTFARYRLADIMSIPSRVARRILRRRPDDLVNEAALTAARRNKRMVTQAEFEEAKDKIMMGAERKSLVMTEEEKMLTAYHKAATPSSAST